MVFPSQSTFQAPTLLLLILIFFSYFLGHVLFPLYIVPHLLLWPLVWELPYARCGPKKKKRKKKNLSTSKTEPFISLNKPLSPHVFILIYLEAWSQIRFSSYFLYMSSFLRSWVFAPNSPTYLNLVLAKVLPPLDSGNWLLPKWSFWIQACSSLIHYPQFFVFCF